MQKLDERAVYILDVIEREDGGYIVYDLSHFYPPYRGLDKARMDERMTHVFDGKTAIVKIIDSRESLTNEQAKQIAKKWVTGDYTNYRLD